MDGMSIGQIAEKLLTFLPFLLALCFHEAAHAWMANRMGDPTAKLLGRMTLNPVPHIDVLGTLVFPLINIFSGTTIMFGWAKPVPIQTRNFGKHRKGLFWTSFAGPGSNILLALVSGLVWGAVARFVPEEFYLFKPMLLVLESSVFINFALAFFNLLPLPPLDGSKIVESFLPYQLAIQFEALTRYSFVILLVLLFSGALRVIGIPVVFAGNITLALAAKIFGF